MLKGKKIMEQFLVYRDMDQAGLVGDLTDLIEACECQAEEKRELRERYSSCIFRMIALAEEYGLEGNLWHCTTALLLANSENAFSRACEKKGAPEGSIRFFAMKDFEKLGKIFSFAPEMLDEYLGTDYAPVVRNYISAEKDGHIVNRRVRDRICELGKELETAKDTADFFNRVTEFYRDFGVGTLGLHKAFRIVEEQDGEPFIQPIVCTEHVSFDQLIGYERQKKRILDNTRSFVQGKEANNVLLYGDAGTGKSSCIKALMNEFYGDGLRLIEVYKHQFRDLPKIIAQIKKRNYKFIIYMDDLSFEEFETEYKYLKAVIEGGLENRPENVLIYATSNRRHLIRETLEDSKDYNQELHSSDTVQEKLSLAFRFGVSIYFGAPDKEEYDRIVLSLAKRAGICMTEEELILEANRWELTHGGRSGRCAQQFIVYLKGKQ